MSKIKAKEIIFVYKKGAQEIASGFLEYDYQEKLIESGNYPGF